MTPSEPLAAPLPARTAWPQATPSPDIPADAARPQPGSVSWDSWYAPRWPPPGAQRWPTPPGGAQWPAEPDATRVDGPVLAGTGELPAAMPGGGRLASAPGGPRRSRGPLIPLIAAAALAAAIAGIVIFWPHSGGVAAHGGTPSASSQDVRRQAAVLLSGLLARSVAERAAVAGAATDVRGCGPSLRQDARTFTSAASSRRRLLSRLGTLPGRSALPAAMLQDLTGAWQASAQVDTDLARWARDTSALGCRPGSRSDAALRASDVPEGQATAGKQAFASLWDPLARRYGLTAYRWYQL